MPKPLPVPPGAERDERSIEMVRAWIAEGRLNVTLNIGFWEGQSPSKNEPDAWGILMADMARHIANAHKDEYRRDRRETLIRVREAFEREMEKATSECTGGFVGDDGVD